MCFCVCEDWCCDVFAVENLLNLPFYNVSQGFDHINLNVWTSIHQTLDMWDPNMTKLAKKKEVFFCNESVASV